MSHIATPSAVWIRPYVEPLLSDLIQVIQEAASSSAISDERLSDVLLAQQHNIKSLGLTLEVAGIRSAALALDLASKAIQEKIDASMELDDPILGQVVEVVLWAVFHTGNILECLSLGNMDDPAYSRNLMRALAPLAKREEVQSWELFAPLLVSTPTELCVESGSDRFRLGMEASWVISRLTVGLASLPGLSVFLAGIAPDLPRITQEAQLAAQSPSSVSLDVENRTLSILRRTLYGLADALRSMDDGASSASLLPSLSSWPTPLKDLVSAYDLTRALPRTNERLGASRIMSGLNISVVQATVTAASDAILSAAEMIEAGEPVQASLASAIVSSLDFLGLQTSARQMVLLLSSSEQSTTSEQMSLVASGLEDNALAALTSSPPVFRSTTAQLVVESVSEKLSTVKAELQARIEDIVEGEGLPVGVGLAQDETLARISEQFDELGLHLPADYMAQLRSWMASMSSGSGIQMSQLSEWAQAYACVEYSVDALRSGHRGAADILFTARQTLVSAGFDPQPGMPMLAPTALLAPPVIPVDEIPASGYTFAEKDTPQASDASVDAYDLVFVEDEQSTDATVPSPSTDDETFADTATTDTATTDTATTETAKVDPDVVELATRPDLPAHIRALLEKSLPPELRDPAMEFGTNDVSVTNESDNRASQKESVQFEVQEPTPETQPLKIPEYQLTDVESESDLAAVNLSSETPEGTGQDIHTLDADVIESDVNVIADADVILAEDSVMSWPPADKSNESDEIPEVLPAYDTGVEFDIFAAKVPGQDTADRADEGTIELTFDPIVEQPVVEQPITEPDIIHADNSISTDGIVLEDAPYQGIGVPEQEYEVVSVQIDTPDSVPYDFQVPAQTDTLQEDTHHSNSVASSNTDVSTDQSVFAPYVDTPAFDTQTQPTPMYDFSDIEEFEEPDLSGLSGLDNLTPSCPSGLRPTLIVPFDAPSTVSIDGDMQEVFNEEVSEELASLSEWTPALFDAVPNPDIIYNIRKSFHTIKGSGRMVGAASLGDMAWAIESVLNRVMDNRRPLSESVIELVLHAQKMIQQYQVAMTGKPACWDIPTMVNWASRIERGEEVPSPFPSTIDWDKIAIELSEGSSISVSSDEDQGYIDQSQGEALVLPELDVLAAQIQERDESQEAVDSGLTFEVLSTPDSVLEWGDHLQDDVSEAEAIEFDFSSDVLVLPDKARDGLLDIEHVADEIADKPWAGAQVGPAELPQPATSSIPAHKWELSDALPEVFQPTTAPELSDELEAKISGLSLAPMGDEEVEPELDVVPAAEVLANSEEGAAPGASSPSSTSAEDVSVEHTAVEEAADEQMSPIPVIEDIPEPILYAPPAEPMRPRPLSQDMLLQGTDWKVLLSHVQDQSIALRTALDANDMALARECVDRQIMALDRLGDLVLGIERTGNMASAKLKSLSARTAVASQSGGSAVPLSPTGRLPKTTVSTQQQDAVSEVRESSDEKITEKTTPTRKRVPEPVAVISSAPENNSSLWKRFVAVLTKKR